MIYPVRIHVVSVQARKDVLRPNPRPNASSPVQLAVAIQPPAAMTEGKLEHDDKIYIDIRERYFKASELDIHPVVVRPPELGESDVSPTKEGEATIRFYINEHGSVDWMEIEGNTLPESMIDKLQSQRNLLHFTPGKKAGLDVKSIVVFRIKLARQSITIPAGAGLQKSLESAK